MNYKLAMCLGVLAVEYYHLIEITKKLFEIYNLFYKA